MPLGMRIRAARRGSEHKVALIAPDLSFVYVPVPKAANSSIKYTLMRIQGVERGKADLNALHADTHPYRSLTELSRDELAQVFRSNTAFRFTFVRNPYSRLTSAYRDKIANEQEPNTGNRYSKKLRLGPRATFAQFVEAVAAQPDRSSDWHWMSQARCTMVQFVQYNFIGRIEALERDLLFVLKTIAPSWNSTDLDTRTNLNASGLTQKLYNERLAALVARRYREDFKIFEYDVESWRDF
jgi:hypothetical protein